MVYSKAAGRWLGLATVTILGCGPEQASCSNRSALPGVWKEAPAAPAGRHLKSQPAACDSTVVVQTIPPSEEGQACDAEPPGYNLRIRRQ